MAVGITIFIMAAIFGVLARDVQKTLDATDKEIAILKEMEQMQREKLHQYETALEFYADEKNWTAPNNVLVELDIDKGFIARSTLERWGK